MLLIENIGAKTGAAVLASLGGTAIFVSVALIVFAENLVSTFRLDDVSLRSIVQLSVTELRQFARSKR